jgi:putative MFS transporter
LFDVLNNQTKITGNQKRIVAAAIIGDLLEFFDYYVMGFVLAFIVGPWHLTFGKSAVILLSAGIGAIFGAFFYGRMADAIGRRKIFMATVVNFSIATGFLALTPQGNWFYLAFFRFLVGFGVGGLYCVDLPLVQEFVPTSKRGRIGGLVTASIPIGLLLGAVLGAYLAPVLGWRGLFAMGLIPGLLTFLIRMWVPESPRWLVDQGRPEEARKSLAWALEVDPESLPLPARITETSSKPGFAALFRHPRSLIASWVTNLGIQTGYYGLTLWAPTLLVLVLGVPPKRAAFLMIWVGLGGFCGRLLISWLSDIMGRKLTGGLAGIAAAVLLVLMATQHSGTVFGIPLFWLLMVIGYAFADGIFAVLGPYSAEVWPTSLRATGMGSAYGFGGIGKVIGPWGLALIVGSSNPVTPAASIQKLVPSFTYLAAGYLLAALFFLFVGAETKGRDLQEIDQQLQSSAAERSALAGTVK